jgi:hypothetical protein
MGEKREKKNNLNQIIEEIITNCQFRHISMSYTLQRYALTLQLSMFSKSGLCKKAQHKNSVKQEFKK